MNDFQNSKFSKKNAQDKILQLLWVSSLLCVFGRRNKSGGKIREKKQEMRENASTHVSSNASITSVTSAVSTSAVAGVVSVFGSGGGGVGGDDTDSCDKTSLMFACMTLLCPLCPFFLFFFSHFSSSFPISSSFFWYTQKTQKQRLFPVHQCQSNTLRKKLLHLKNVTALSHFLSYFLFLFCDFDNKISESGLLWWVIFSNQSSSLSFFFLFNCEVEAKYSGKTGPTKVNSSSCTVVNNRPKK